MLHVFKVLLGEKVKEEKQTNITYYSQWKSSSNEDNGKRKMNINECAELLAELEPDGKKLLKEHIECFGEVLLHNFAGDITTERLIELLMKRNIKEASIQSYCDAIELMWREGDDAVVNVVDVTILERLSDDDGVWQKFGTYISEEFKRYINFNLLPTNAMMWGVEKLRFGKEKKDTIQKALEKEVGQKSGLKDLVDAFESMCKLPIDGVKKEEDMILFQTGTYSFTGEPLFYFSLVRQFPNADEEYYQLHLDVLYTPKENIQEFQRTSWDFDIEENIFEHIRKSEEYFVLKDEPIKKISIYMDET